MAAVAGMQRYDALDTITNVVYFQTGVRHGF